MFCSGGRSRVRPRARHSDLPCSRSADCSAGVRAGARLSCLDTHPALACVADCPGRPCRRYQAPARHSRGTLRTRSQVAHATLRATSPGPRSRLCPARSVSSSPCSQAQTTAITCESRPAAIWFCPRPCRSSAGGHGVPRTGRGSRMPNPRRVMVYSASVVVVPARTSPIKTGKWVAWKPYSSLIFRGCAR